MSNIVDYIYTCGLDVHSGLEPFNLDGKAIAEKLRLPLERSYKCRILQHFPDYPSSGSFDAESTSVVTMPTGLPLYTQKQLLAQASQYPRRHSFVITRADGRRVNGAALLFPVRVENANVLETICSLQDLTLGRLSNSAGGVVADHTSRVFDPTKDTLYTLKAFGLLSRYQFIHGLFGWLEDVWASIFLSSASSDDENVIEMAVRKLLYETVLPSSGHYITFTGVFRDHCGYYPAPGASVDGLLDGLCQVPNAMELTLFEYSLLDLLKLISPDCLLRLLSCVLMEHRIILFSTVYYRLMLVAEGITCLLLPFTWPHVYAPILPLSLVHFVDAPVPYIMGIKQCEYVLATGGFHDCNTTECMASFELASETNVCYVYIDEGHVVIPDEVPAFPNAEQVKRSLSVLLAAAELCHSRHSDKSSCTSSSTAPIPRPRPPKFSLHPRPIASLSGSSATQPSRTSDPEHESLVNCFLDTARKLICSDSSIEYNHLLHFNTAIRTVFLHNFADIFRHYDKFFVSSDKLPDQPVHQHQQSALHAFDKVGFLSDQSETLLPFLSAFMETQMFTSFLDLCLNRAQSSGAGLSPPNSPRWQAALINVSLFEYMIAATSGQSERGTIGPAIVQIASEDGNWSAQPSVLASTPSKYPLPDLLADTTFNRGQSSSQPVGFPHFFLTKTPRSERPSLPCAQSANQIQFPPLRRELITAPVDLNATDRTSPPVAPIRPPVFPASSAPASPPFSRGIRQSLSPGYQSTPIRRVTHGNDLTDLTVPAQHMDDSLRVLHPFAQSHQLTTIQHSGMAQTNWDFIDTLLGECKQKIRRMVLKKMGTEAVELGHEDPTVSAIEENTLVSGFCDLLERIWSHELVNKSGKSALWSHLVHYVRRHQARTAERQSTLSSASSHDDSSDVTHQESSRSEQSNNPPPPPQKEWTSPTDYIEPTGNTRNSSYRKIRASSTTRIGSFARSNDQTPPQSSVPELGWRALTTGRVRNALTKSNTSKSPLFKRITPFTPNADSDSADWSLDLGSIFGVNLMRHSLVLDVLTVKRIPGVKTDIGFARAFVRLALEKKLLSAHLTELLSDVKLTRKLYSRYAFLRCEEEREQFLLHLLSLNAVDYYSFTRMLPQAQLIYRLYLCTGRKYGFSSTANVWIRLHGHLSSTQALALPRGQRLIDIRSPNLGLLSVLQIGHDNSGPTPKLFVDSIFVYNTVTNHVYQFPCGRWIGKGIEDDASERLLIAERVRFAEPSSRLDDSNAGENTQQTFARLSVSGSGERSSSVSRTLDPIELRERLANAINQLLKHCVNTQLRSQASTNLTHLWYGRDGLLPSLQAVFQYGFRSARLFQRRIYLWDYMEKASATFAVGLGLFDHREFTHSLPAPAISSTVPRYSTNSLPRPNRRQPLRSLPGSATPGSIRAFPSNYALQEAAGHRAQSYTYSQPNSPSPYRLLSSAIRDSPSVDSSVLGSHDDSQLMRQLSTQLVHHVRHVARKAAHLGKEDRFQRFISYAIQQHLLVAWISVLALSPVTEQMFELRSFLLNQDLRNSLQDLLSSLDGFDFPLDPILFGDNH